jgi:hypothetical protein
MSNSPTRIEKWLPIVGYEDVYSVSDMGRVRRDVGGLKRSGGIIKGTIGGVGYRTVALFALGAKVKKTHNVHSLVLETFIGPRPEGHCCNHKDGNKANNLLENLEWVTNSENHKHSFRELGRQPARGSANRRNQITEFDVIAIRHIFDNGIATPKKMAEIFGLSYEHIIAICSRARWKGVK